MLELENIEYVASGGVARSEVGESNPQGDITSTIHEESNSYNNMPMMAYVLNGYDVSVLQDTGSDTTVVRQGLV